MREWRCQLAVEPAEYIPSDVSAVAALLAIVEEAFEAALLRPCSGSGVKPGGRSVDVGWAYFTEAEARAVEQMAMAVCEERGWRASSEVYQTGDEDKVLGKKVCPRCGPGGICASCMSGKEE